jgi:hypothetical protein
VAYVGGLRRSDALMQFIVQNSVSNYAAATLLL